MFKELLQKFGVDVGDVEKPNHVALNMFGIKAWARENNIALPEAYKKSFDNLFEIASVQIKIDLPILTVSLLPTNKRGDDDLIDSMIDFINRLSRESLLYDNKVKVSIIGKWYDLPSRIIEPIKHLINQTKDYDTFFLNLCINYNGQEEIVDACKLIARKVQSGKIEIDAINKMIIKENLYTSYFVPPDIMITTGIANKTYGVLLWDISRSQVCFTGKRWPDFTTKNFLEAITKWRKQKSRKVIV